MRWNINVSRSAYREARGNRVRPILTLMVAPVLAGVLALSGPGQADASHIVSANHAICDGRTNTIHWSPGFGDYVRAYLFVYVHGYGWLLTDKEEGPYGVSFTNPRNIRDGWYYRVIAYVWDARGRHVAEPSHYRMAASVLGIDPYHPSYCKIW